MNTELKPTHENIVKTMKDNILGRNNTIKNFIHATVDFDHAVNPTLLQTPPNCISPTSYHTLFFFTSILK